MELNKTEISVVVPVYGCEDSLKELCARLETCLTNLVSEFEIILVDDRGAGNAWSIIKNLANDDPRIKGIKLSRNFGQHSAIFAGLTRSSGEKVVVMDCDLQDLPEEIEKLYDKSKEGFQIVFAQRFNRKDSYLKKLRSRTFYKFFSYLVNSKLDTSVANFGIFSRKAVDAVLQMPEQQKWFPSMMGWVGFTSVSVPVNHGKRKHGDSSYTLKKLIKLSFSVMMSFSNKPLKLIIKLGFLISLFSISYAFWIIFSVLIYGVSFPGWASVMASVWIVGGVTISIIGVVGLYIGKAFDEVKARPIYIIEEDTYQ